MEHVEILTLMSEHLLTEDSQPKDLHCHVGINPDVVRCTMEGRLKVNGANATFFIEEENGLTIIFMRTNYLFDKNVFSFTLLTEDLNKERLTKMLDLSVKHKTEWKVFSGF